MSSHSLAALYGLLHAPWVGRLGWTLIHSLWQGGLLALAFATLSRRPGTTADTRYLGACATLLLMAACPAMTWVVLGPAVDAGHGRSFVALAGGPWDSLPGWAALLWLAGIGVLSVRVLGGWARVQRLRRVTAPLPDPLHRRAKTLARRMGITRRLYVRASSAVQVPTVIGWVRRVVLVPTALVSGLPPAALEALLAHEFAHVRRHDYLVNFVQTLLETLLFYHPAAWWVSHRIRVEREHCCDDLAAALVGDRVLYARALTALEETRHGTLALAASDGDLLGRIRRLLSVPSPDVPLPLSTAGLSLVLGLWMAAVVWPVTLWSLVPAGPSQGRVGLVVSAPRDPVRQRPVALSPRPSARPSKVSVAAAPRRTLLVFEHFTRRYLRLPIRPRMPEVRHPAVRQSRLDLSPIRVLPAVLTTAPDVSAAEAAPDVSAADPQQGAAPEATASVGDTPEETAPAPVLTIVEYRPMMPVMIRVADFTARSPAPAAAPAAASQNASDGDDRTPPAPEIPSSPAAPAAPADPGSDKPHGYAAPNGSFPDKGFLERMRALQDRMMRLQVQMQALAEQMRQMQDQLQSQMQQFQGQWPRPKQPAAGKALPGSVWAPSNPPAATPDVPSETILMQ